MLVERVRGPRLSCCCFDSAIVLLISNPMIYTAVILCSLFVGGNSFKHGITGRPVVLRPSVDVGNPREQWTARSMFGGISEKLGGIVELVAGQTTITEVRE